MKSICRQGLDRAFDLLKGRTRTGCQALIIFVTDGRDTDGEAVRCGPGMFYIDVGIFYWLGP